MRYFKLPDLGEGLPEAEIVEWHVQAGDTVKLDQILVAVETAKAIVEVPSPCDGKIARLFGAAGDCIHTGEPLVEFADQQDEDSGTVVGSVPVNERIDRDHAASKIESGPDNKQIKNNQFADHFTIGGTEAALDPRLLATPAIRNLARHLEVDLSDIQASGKHGAITHQDVERAAHLKAEYGEAESLRGVRRSMAQAMARAHEEVVKVTICEDADIENWDSNNDITLRLIRAIANASVAEPNLNCWYENAGQRRRVMERIDLGIAVDTAEGLFVPVLRDVRNRDQNDLAAGLAQLRQAVESRKIPPDELRGATITLSNFGRFTGRYADPVVVPPMVAIVGAGRVRKEPVAVDSKVEVHSVLPLSVSFDHRVVTGGEASRFLAAMIFDLQLSN